jgi:membrane protease YdiL (CAAX protease family)
LKAHLLLTRPLYLFGKWLSNFAVLVAMVIVRAAPLPHLWQMVGKRQAIWLMALWFGLGHYYGGVSFGAVGVIYLTLVAVLFGKAMLESKGLAMPVFMHLLGDVVLYIILALGSA